MTFTSHWTYTIDRDARIERREGSLPSAEKLPAVSVTVAPNSSHRLTARLLRRLADEIGLISSFFDLLTFAMLLLLFHADEATFQTFWFLASLLTELAVVLVLRTRKPALLSSPSRLLLWSTLGVAAAAFTIPFLGQASSMFGFVPLSALQICAVIAIVLGYAVATEVGKAWFFRLK